MPAKKDAEYWRNYRARKAEAAEDVPKADRITAAAPALAEVGVDPRDARILELEEEVKNLKRQLAMKKAGPGLVDPSIDVVPGPTQKTYGSFGHSRPAPKPGTKK